MYIYKFTHIKTGRVYIGQTIQNPNQRRLEHIADSRYTTKEYHFHNALRKDGGPMKGKICSTEHKKVGEANKGKKLGMTWEEIYGPEIAASRKQAMKERALARKQNMEVSV
jgi:hypothetical protein